jgi:hypothetical protein
VILSSKCWVYFFSKNYNSEKYPVTEALTTNVRNKRSVVSIWRKTVLLA